MSVRGGVTLYSVSALVCSSGPNHLSARATQVEVDGHERRASERSRCIDVKIERVGGEHEGSCPQACAGKRRVLIDYRS